MQAQSTDPLNSNYDLFLLEHEVSPPACIAPLLIIGSHRQTLGTEDMEDTALMNPNEESLPAPRPPSSPCYTTQPRRSKRTHLFPKALKDFLPTQATPLPHIPTGANRGPIRSISHIPQTNSEHFPLSPTIPPSHLAPGLAACTSETIETEPDEFGLYRVYTRYPSRDPEQDRSLDSLCASSGNFSIIKPPQPDPSSVFGTRAPHEAQTPKSTFAPFLNISIFLLMSWFYNTAAKSLNDLQNLVSGVLLHPDFKLSHLEGFSAVREQKRADNDQKESILSGDDGWKEGYVELPLPILHLRTKEDSAPKLRVDGIVYRDILEVVRSAFQEPRMLEYHLSGFRQMWKPNAAAPAQQVHGETYFSPHFLEMEEEVLHSARGRGETRETVVVPVHLYSDSTRLANFGTASLWPGYLSIGLLSKYVRGEVSSFSQHHFAYFPKLPDSLGETYAKYNNGKPPSAEVITFLKRELFQAVWRLLLNPDFIHAYLHGFEILCYDGIIRLFFIRFFTYSADYPEKYAA
jgi:hypothetical protein